MSSTKKTTRRANEAATNDSVAVRGWNHWLFAGFLVAMYVSLVYPSYDTDFWWHLRTGELIFERGAVPQVDWFTYTDSDKAWIDLHWGFQVLVTVLYRLGGINLVILVKAAIITAAVGIAWRTAGLSLPAWLKAFFWFLPLVAISGRGYERPEILSQLFLATWLFIIFRAESRPRLLWALPVVQAVWCNCHALFALGLVVGGCYAADRVVRQLAQGRFGLELPPAAPDFPMLFRVGALVALACFATPYFEEGALFPLTIYRKFNVEQAFYSVNIGEFQQPIQFVRRFGLKNMYLLAEMGVWFSTAASFAWLFVRTRRWSVLRALLFFAYSHLAWEATRNTNVFSIVSGVLLCANVGDVLAARRGEFSPPAERGLYRVVGIALASFIVLVVTGQWNRWGDGNKPFGLGEGEAWYIHDAAKFAGQAGFPNKAFVANNGQAAVYIYHNAPDRLVFMDGRLEVCTLQTFQSYLHVLHLMAVGDLSWQSIVDPNGDGLPVVILDSRGSRLPINGMLNTPGWRLVFADPSAAVFLDSALAEQLNLPRVSPEPLMYPPGTKRPAEPPSRTR